MRFLVPLLLLTGFLRVPAQGQTRFTVDPRYSLGWWQVDPHLQHLWATTCPQEPSWRPGEGRSGGWSIGAGLRNPAQGYAAISDSGKVPLYPRFEALDICTEAVTGEITIADTTQWTGIHGKVLVKAEALVTGEDRRDAYARDAVLETTHYPHIIFTIDSVIGVKRQADTLRGTAYGVLELHGVERPLVGPVHAWPEAGGLRVMGRVKVPAQQLVEVFDLSRFALGLGVVTHIWRTIFMGVDIVVFPAKA
jgi:polyisoprenoid-binding protein YceI